ncbi:MAG TPA: hypothetical protein VH640_29775 [Bryobacteraceae bacterium]|jgi:hypothetical protein
MFGPVTPLCESLVEGFHSHGAHASGNQPADRIIYHRRRDTRFQAKAIRQIRGAIELSAAHMNLTFGSPAKWNHTRVQTVY